MSAVAVLAALRQAGVALIPDGDALRYKAPTGVLTDAMRQAIREQKAELLALLRSDAPSDDVIPCRHCGAPTPIAAMLWGHCLAPACDIRQPRWQQHYWPWRRPCLRAHMSEKAGGA